MITGELGSTSAVLYSSCADVTTLPAVIANCAWSYGAGYATCAGAPSPTPTPAPSPVPSLGADDDDGATARRRRRSAVVRLADTDDPADVTLRANCTAAGVRGAKVSLWVHEAYPLGFVSHGAPAALGASFGVTLDACAGGAGAAGADADDGGGDDAVDDDGWSDDGCGLLEVRRPW